MFKCKMCDKLTEAIVNINFKAVSLCDPCASSIAVQQVQWWATECTPKAKELVPTPNSASTPCEQCEHFTGDFNNGVCGACRWSQPDKFTQRT